MDSVKEFLLSVQQQSALTRFNDAFASTTTLASLIDFSGLCRLDLKVTFIGLSSRLRLSSLGNERDLSEIG